MRYAITISRLILNRELYRSMHVKVSSTSGITVLEGVFAYPCSSSGVLISVLATRHWYFVGVLDQGPPCWCGRRPFYLSRVN